MGERKEEKLDLDQFVNHFTAAMESGEEAPIRRAISLLGLAHQQLGVRLAIVGPELAQAIVNVPWKSDRFRW
jgi:hypothetical protein